MPVAVPLDRSLLLYYLDCQCLTCCETLRRPLLLNSPQLRAWSYFFLPSPPHACCLSLSTMRWTAVCCLWLLSKFYIHLEALASSSMLLLRCAVLGVSGSDVGGSCPFLADRACGFLSRAVLRSLRVDTSEEETQERALLDSENKEAIGRTPFQGVAIVESYVPHVDFLITATPLPPTYPPSPTSTLDYTPR